VQEVGFKRTLLFFILMTLPLFFVYTTMRYREISETFLERFAYLVKMNLRDFTSMFILLMFIISVVFGALFIREFVRSVQSIIWTER